MNSIALSYTLYLLCLPLFYNLSRAEKSEKEFFRFGYSFRMKFFRVFVLL